MAEEYQVPSHPPESSVTTPQTETAPEKTQTIEDVAKKYNVDQMVQNFTAAPAVPTTPAYPPTPPYTPPDPITNPEQWNQYQTNLLMQNQQTQGVMRELGQKLESLTRETQQAKLDVEVNKAVAKVNEKLKIDPMYAEIALEKRYRADPIFKRIWDNRQLNPKALDEALDVITNDLSGVFQVKTDPQLTENLRAAKQSQKTQASTSRENSTTERLMGMNDAEFDLEWGRIKRGY